MFPDYVVKKKDLIQSVTTAFLPRKVLIPLKQESEVLCSPLVKKGDKVQEGQVIAESAQGTEAAKIHSSIPGLVLGIKNCAEPDGRNGCAVEIQLNGQFSHIGKSARALDWLSWGASSITNKISALGIVNTFSMRNGRSLSTDIQTFLDSQGSIVFARLFDEDPTCQTDRVMANSNFEKIQKGIEIIKRVLNPEEIVFAIAKNSSLQAKLTALKSEIEDTKITVIQFDTRAYPIGTKENIAGRYKKLARSQVHEREIARNSLFVDATTLAVLSDALIYNIPVERVYIHVFGDCLKSSAVLKACVGASIGSLAEQLGLETKKIGKIIVNGHLNGFSVPSLDTPITKWVKSVSFITKTDLADYSSAFCMGCGKCSAACPSKIYPNVLYGYLIKSIKIPQDFIRASLLCIECGVCNSACPTKLPLAEIVKILKDRQNA